MKFEYQAIDANGDIVRGIVQARSAEKVLQILLYKQLHPLDIRPLTETTVELSRLNNLRRKLEGKEMDPKPSEPETEPERFDPIKEPKEPIDWTYPIFLVLILGVLIVAILLG